MRAAPVQPAEGYLCPAPGRQWCGVVGSGALSPPFCAYPLGPFQIYVTPVDNPSPRSTPHLTELAYWLCWRVKERAWPR